MNSRTTGIYLIVALGAVVTLILALSRVCAVEAAYPAGRCRQLFVDCVWSRVTGLFDGVAASAENVRLRREVAAAAVLRGDLERLEAENARLRRLLEFKASTTGDWLAGGVLSRGGGAAGVREVVRVDRGSLDGVEEGAVVVASEGLVGRVSLVTPHTSEIALVTDPSIKVSCEVEGSGGERLLATLCGGSEEELVLRYFRGGAKVSPAARVVTSGRGGVFPRGIEVGVMLSLEGESRTSGSVGRVRPGVDFPNLEHVFIRRGK